MPAILALLLACAQADDSPFTAPPKYTAKITFGLGVLWIKGEKYKLHFTQGPTARTGRQARRVRTRVDSWGAGCLPLNDNPPEIRGIG